MKLQKIERIKGYKSYEDFNWQSFLGNENFHENVNIFYGENGGGKSSVCNILKSVCGKKPFSNNQIPDEVCLKFDDDNYKFSNGENVWDKNKGPDDFLFFDREFVHDNIHLGNTRDTQADGQEQRSGKMIIEFDSEAIRLSKLKKSFKKQISKSEEGEPETIFDKLKTYQEEHKDTLDFSLSDNKKTLFEIYKDKTKEEITDLKKELSKEKKETEKKLETDKATQKQVNDIQSSISEISNEKIEIAVSEQSAYQALFNFDLKEQIQIQAEQDLITRIRQHKDFFKTGIEIREEHKTKCPFCQSENEEENIGKIIKAYNDVFDDTYKKQLQAFEDNKKILIEELENIINAVKNYDLNSVFVSLIELNQKYKIKDIYSVEEQKKYKKPTTSKIADLKKKIDNLKKPSNEDIANVCAKTKTEFDTLETFFNDIYTFVDGKNQLIRKFKADNTDEKIQQRITANNRKTSENELKLAFFNEKEIEKQKQKEAKDKELASIQKKFDDLKARHDKAKEDYENRCSGEVFQGMLSNMQKYFLKFNFDFTLELKKERMGNKTETPFAFKLLDTEGNERDFKEGLSEGELQVLSLCFFFAFLDIQTNPENKILVFDDPITSLDNNNLSHLVDLIAEEHIKFSQTFIFTHHRTFFKFLQKKLNTSAKQEKRRKADQYYIFRNGKKYGGSFLCPYKVDDIQNKLSKLNKHLIDRAQEEGISEELLSIEYGQYLRYSIEDFIKNKILHLNDSNFGGMLQNMIVKKESSKDLSVEDLIKLKDIYSFCNWTTSHVDNGDDNSLTLLQSKVDDYIKIVNR